MLRLERVESIMARKVQPHACQWEYMAGTPHVSVHQESEKDRCGVWLTPILKSMQSKELS